MVVDAVALNEEGARGDCPVEESPIEDCCWSDMQLGWRNTNRIWLAKSGLGGRKVRSIQRSFWVEKRGS